MPQATRRKTQGTDETATVGGSGLDRTLWGAVLVAVALAVLALVSSSTALQPDNAVALLWTLIDSGPRAVLYLVAAGGWGVLLAWTVRKASGTEGQGWDTPALAVGLGISFMLTVSHALGATGAFGGLWGLSGRVWALLPVVLGVAVAAIPACVALNRGVDLTTLFVPLRWTGRAPIATAWICGGAVLFVAACNPPGALWGSEFGGFDVRSYHLQLPKEWLAQGVLRPLDHNVYSYLPGYVEAAFLHLGAMAGSRDLLDGDGTVLMSAQLLCAGMTVLAAWSAGRAGLSAALASGVSEPSARLAAAATAAAVMVIPWMLVVGSMAYNESALVLLLACACSVALRPLGSADPRTSPSVRVVLVRGVVAGWLVGVACGVKPTAIFLGAPAIGLMMLWSAPPRAWAALTLGACAAGALAISPWLARNWLASGNPVFPQLAGLFGTGHWSADQVARYLSAHHFQGGWGDRLRLMFLADPSDPSGPRHRGPAHEQWAWFFPVLVASLGLLATVRLSRRMGILLSVCVLVQMLAWLAFTHVQARFLLPLVATGACAMGALAAIAHQARSANGLVHKPSDAALPRWAGLLLPAMLWALVPCGAYSVHRFLSEGPGTEGPNGLLALGPGALSGSIGRATFEELTDSDRAQFLEEAGPSVYCNFTVRDGDVLYLLGDSTPLYYTGTVIYNTTYDASLLAEAIAANPESPPRWIDALHQRGVTRVLVNYAEIDRLRRSGWIDPRLTPEAIQKSIAAFGQRERDWGDSLVLYRMN